jgi:hypothetical protein
MSRQPRSSCFTSCAHTPATHVELSRCCLSVAHANGAKSLCKPAHACACPAHACIYRRIYQAPVAADASMLQRT